jgi:hypothetical protein
MEREHRVRFEPWLIRRNNERLSRWHTARFSTIPMQTKISLHFEKQCTLWHRDVTAGNSFPNFINMDNNCIKQTISIIIINQNINNQHSTCCLLIHFWLSRTHLGFFFFFSQSTFFFSKVDWCLAAVSTVARGKRRKENEFERCVYRMKQNQCIRTNRRRRQVSMCRFRRRRADRRPRRQCRSACHPQQHWQTLHLRCRWTLSPAATALRRADRALAPRRWRRICCRVTAMRLRCDWHLPPI